MPRVVCRCVSAKLMAPGLSGQWALGPLAQSTFRDLHGAGAGASRAIFHVSHLLAALQLVLVEATCPRVKVRARPSTSRLFLRFRFRSFVGMHSEVLA